jgi:hypothetical protein
MHHEMIQSLLDSQRYDHTAMGGAAPKPSQAPHSLGQPAGHQRSSKNE